ncbi:MAG: DNA repair protein RecO [Lachnospiraceae bacterium]|nr:DNA repair protein RecO [Lachnospiraceae bacterium]
MQDFISVTGIIIKQMPVGESDRRITILTNTRGKISVFARGARKPNSRFAATTCPFCFGSFKHYEGRDAYNLADVDIKNYFEEFRSDLEGSFYAAYFAEIVDYYCRENNDEREMMKLFYQSLRALCNENLPDKLIRAVYELKSIVVNGEYPGPPGDMPLSESALYTLDFICNTPVESLYRFKVTEGVLAEVRAVSEKYRKRFMEHNFKSLDMLDGIEGE